MAGRPSGQAAAMTRRRDRAPAKLARTYRTVTARRSRSTTSRIDIPSRIMVGRDRAGRRRQVDAARAHRRRAEDPGRATSSCFDKRHRATAAHRASMPRPHRLYAAGPRPQSLSDAERVREHRFLRPPVRPGRARSGGADHRASHARRAWRNSKPAPPASSPAA